MRPEEIDDDVDVGTAVAGGHGTFQLKASQRLALTVALPQERVDKLRIFAIAERVRIQGEIHV